MPRNLLKNKSGLPVFLLSLVLSCGIWLTHNLTLEYTDVVSVTVVAHSNIDSRAPKSTNTAQIVARCSASGFYLLSKKLSASDVVDVEFDASDFTDLGGGNFSLSSSVLESYFPDIFGTHCTLVSFISRNAQFHFPQQSCKKVPVKALCTISCKPQYSVLEEMDITPDSVLVYGEPDLISSINVVTTRQFSLKDLSADSHGTVDLKSIPGIRFSTEKVDWFLEVDRYVEVSSRVRVNLRNAPSSVPLEIFPLTVEAFFKCRFPYEGNPVDRMEFYVDYNDFEKSISGKCVVRHDPLPSGVISCRIDPSICECFLREEDAR